MCFHTVIVQTVIVLHKHPQFKVIDNTYGHMILAYCSFERRYILGIEFERLPVSASENLLVGPSYIII